MKEAVFSLNETLKKGLALTVNARNQPFLVESIGAFPYENALMSVEQFDPIDTSSLGTLPFPYPQLFVCSDCTIVCTPTAIYEYVAGSLVLKIDDLPEGLTWTCIDYKTFIYLSNCSCAVIKSPQTGEYSIDETLQYVPSRAGCDYFGQAVISPCPDYEEPEPVPEPPGPSPCIPITLSVKIVGAGENAPITASVDLSNLKTGTVNINTPNINDPLPVYTTISVDLSKFQTGIISASGEALVSIDLSSLIPTNETDYTFYGCALTEACVNAILAVFVAASGYISGTLDLSGGTSSAPTGQGLTDVTTLTTRGVTVNVNT